MTVSKYQLSKNNCTLSVKKDHFQRKILKNCKNTYGLILHLDYTHERKTFLGQEITII